jgi:hypothetical protein
MAGAEAKQTPPKFGSDYAVELPNWWQRQFQRGLLWFKQYTHTQEKAMSEHYPEISVSEYKQQLADGEIRALDRDEANRQFADLRRSVRRIKRNAEKQIQKNNPK